MPQGYGATIAKTRLFQDRAIRNIGIDAHKYTDAEIARLSAVTPEYVDAKGISAIDWDKFFSQYLLNPNATAGFFSRAGFKEAQVEVIRGKYDERTHAKTGPDGIAQKEWIKYKAKLAAKGITIRPEEEPVFYDLIHRTVG